MTLTPAYGRDYTTAKGARASWDRGDDWIINQFFHPYDGKPINQVQAVLEGLDITLRFDNLRKVAVIS